MQRPAGLPPKQGLYDPRHEHDACGIGFVVNIKGEKSNKIVRQALTALENLDHRGARGSEENTGDTVAQDGGCTPTLDRRGNPTAEIWLSARVNIEL